MAIGPSSRSSVSYTDNSYSSDFESTSAHTAVPSTRTLVADVVSSTLLEETSENLSFTDKSECLPVKLDAQSSCIHEWSKRLLLADQPPASVIPTEQHRMTADEARCTIAMKQIIITNMNTHFSEDPIKLKYQQKTDSEDDFVLPVSQETLTRLSMQSLLHRQHKMLDSLTPQLDKDREKLISLLRKKEAEEKFMMRVSSKLIEDKLETFSARIPTSKIMQDYKEALHLQKLVSSNNVSSFQTMLQ